MSRRTGLADLEVDDSGRAPVSVARIELDQCSSAVEITNRACGPPGPMKRGPNTHHSSYGNEVDAYYSMPFQQVVHMARVRIQCVALYHGMSIRVCVSCLA
jgi:hypothetical protein